MNDKDVIIHRPVSECRRFPEPVWTGIVSEYAEPEFEWRVFLLFLLTPIEAGRSAD
jgi:hypothetical protein